LKGNNGLNVYGIHLPIYHSALYLQSVESGAVAES
jgi:hypothetical protein